MAWLRWLAVATIAVESAWMTFDGARALLVGDYVTPSSGQYAGQLGPWANVIAGIGIDPRSTAMKATFVGLGVIGLVCAVAFAKGMSWAYWALLFFAVTTLWYLVMGTVASAVAVAVLLVPAVRNSYL